MALVFTDWEHATDDITTIEYILDWSSVAAMRGRLMWPYMEAIRQATVERAHASGSGFSPALGSPSSHGESSLALAGTIGTSLGYIADDILPAYTGGAWLEFEPVSGDWTNYDGGNIPYYSEDGARGIQGYLDYLGEDNVPGSDAAAWCFQRYKILNLMQYRGYTDGNKDIGNGGGYPSRVAYRNSRWAYKSEGDGTWSGAVTAFNNDTFSAWTHPYNNVAESSHYGSHNPSNGLYGIYRRATRDKLNNFPTNCAKQVVWYQLSSAVGEFEDNDRPGVSGAGKLYPVWTGPVDSAASTDWFELGYINDATMSEPVSTQGYQWVGAWGSLGWGNGYIVVNWGVEGGFTFKNPPVP